MVKTRHLVSYLLNNYKKNAERRGISFSLSRDEFLALILQDCYICGSKPSNIARRKHTLGIFYYTGLDRVDNSQGYTRDNVMPCCHKCNAVKAKMSLDELKSHLKKMLKGLKGVSV